MPPRTRRAANQENTVGAGPPPASPIPISKKRKIATEPEPTPRPSRILQDITSQFIEPEVPLEGSKPTLSKEEPQPPRRKRRAKAPIRRLAKRKQLVDGPSHHPAIPSSLPPSSPPSESSRFDVIHQAFAGPRFVQNRSPSAEYGNENENPFSEFDGKFDPSLDLLPEAASSNQADPFGFLAVESKLKAQREAAQPFQVLTDLDLPVDDDHPTPHPDTFENDNDENIVPLGVPSTPHKRKKRRSITTSPNSAALFNPSPQSTPSPSKPRRSLAGGNRSPVDSSDSELVLSRPPAASVARRARISAVAQKSRKEVRAPKKSLTPKTLGKSLESLLPKRVTRVRAASSKGRGKRGREAMSDEEDESSPRKMKKRATVIKKPTSKAKGKMKATEVEDEEIDLDGAQEKLKQERQARLEYFKKLDSYKVEEENVYVV